MRFSGFIILRLRVGPTVALSAMLPTEMELSQMLMSLQLMTTKMLSTTLQVHQAMSQALLASRILNESFLVHLFPTLRMCILCVGHVMIHVTHSFLQVSRWQSSNFSCCSSERAVRSNRCRSWWPADGIISQLNLGIGVCWVCSCCCVLVRIDSMHSSSLRFIHACVSFVNLFKQRQKAAHFQRDCGRLGSFFGVKPGLLSLTPTQIFSNNDTWNGFKDIWMHVGTLASSRHQNSL